MLSVNHAYVNYDRTEILKDVSIQIDSGGIYALLGHNGAGKTTLLRAIGGLLPIRSGAVKLDGEDITVLHPNRRVKRGLGYVPQGQQCFPQMTGWENLYLVDRDRAAIAEALDPFPELVGVLKRAAGLLSGGQRQQLAIARALLARPRLLILDEPTEGIQPNVVDEIHRAIIELSSSSNLTVLLADQHVSFAAGCATKYFVLSSGRITSSGAGGLGAFDSMSAALAV